MNILVTTSTFPRWGNDIAALFVFELCRRLREQGLNIVVLAPHAEGAQKFEMMEGIKVYRYQYLPEAMERLSGNGGILAGLQKNKWGVWQVPFFLLAQLCSLGKIVCEEKIDTIHAHWLIPQGLVAVIYKKFFNRRIRVVCTSHGSDVMALKGFLFDGIKKFVIRRSDKVTVVSNALKEEVRRLVPSMSVEVLPMGVDLKQFTPDHYSGEIRRRYSIDGPFLLFVGRLSEEKGIKYLLKAMPQILGRFPVAKLILVGTGPLENELKAMVEGAGIAANVVFAGPVAHASLAAYYATADVLIGPSIREGFGLVFIEAMACGCPVIASDLPGILDIVVDGKTGFLVRPGDHHAVAGKVIEVLHNKRFVEEVKSRACQYVIARFSADRAAAGYKDILA